MTHIPRPENTVSLPYIAVPEDREDIANLICDELSACGYRCFSLRSKAAVERFLRDVRPRLAIGGTAPGLSCMSPAVLERPRGPSIMVGASLFAISLPAGDSGNARRGSSGVRVSVSGMGQLFPPHSRRLQFRERGIGDQAALDLQLFKG